MRAHIQKLPFKHWVQSTVMGDCCSGTQAGVFLRALLPNASQDEHDMQLLHAKHVPDHRATTVHLALPGTSMVKFRGFS